MDGYIVYDKIEEILEKNIKNDRKESIPMLSVSMNIDKYNYLPRLLASIDFPIDRICIQIGNSDPKVVQDIVRSVQLQRLKSPQLQIQLSTLNYNPGSAIGFNFGLRNMMLSHENIPWVLVVNNDIAFYPGVLKTLYEKVTKEFDTNSKFGIGFTSLCCGGEWSAVVFTKRMVEKIGYFDENFYPAYYEDDDYSIRVFLSSYKAVRFDNTPMLHGKIDGSKDYGSGVVINLYFQKSLTPGEWAWRKSQEKGQILSKTYLENKWNVKISDFKQKKSLDCKTVEGINNNCQVGFTSPFGDTTKSISYWQLNEKQFNMLVAMGSVT